MKKRTKISLVLSSAAAILLAGSIMAGGTYALFTSESKTNIAVTSGKVEVKASVTELTTYTGKDLTGVVEDDAIKIKKSTEYNLEDGQFMNGGTAVYDSNTGALTLDKMTPGDKVTFTIKVENKSTVNVKYRTVLKTEENDGLFEGLKVTIDGTKYDGTEITSAYFNLFPGNEPDDINVSIELPTDASNTYQNMKCKIISSVEAIQGNARLEGTTSVTSKTDLTSAINNGNPVSLSDDFSFDKNEWISVSNDVTNLTIYGNGETLKASSEAYGSSGSGRVINVEEHSNPLTITLVDLNIEGPTNNEYNRGISLYKNTGKVKVVLDNCKVSANHYALNVASENNDVEIVAKNTTFVGYSAFQTWSANTKATFTNCTFKGVNQWDGTNSNGYATIVVQGDATNSELTFKKCTIEAEEQGTAKEHLLSIRAASTFNFSDCTFKHTSNGQTINCNLEDEYIDYQVNPGNVTINKE